MSLPRLPTEVITDDDEHEEVPEDREHTRTQSQPQALPPRLPKLQPVVSQSHDGSETKLNIGIDLAGMKASRYEQSANSASQSGVSGHSVTMNSVVKSEKQNKRRQSVRMEHVEEQQKNKELEAASSSYAPSSYEAAINEGMLSITGASFEDKKRHRVLPSFTNANAEGIGGIDRILSEAKRIQEEDEESSFTMKSGDLSVAISPMNSDRNVGPGGKVHLLSPKVTQKVMPTEKTKSHWM